MSIKKALAMFLTIILGMELVGCSGIGSLNQSSEKVSQSQTDQSDLERLSRLMNFDLNPEHTQVILARSGLSIDPQYTFCVRLDSTVASEFTVWLKQYSDWNHSTVSFGSDCDTHMLLLNNENKRESAILDALMQSNETQWREDDNKDERVCYLMVYNPNNNVLFFDYLTF